MGPPPSPLFKQSFGVSGPSITGHCLEVAAANRAEGAKAAAAAACIALLREILKLMRWSALAPVGCLFSENDNRVRAGRARAGPRNQGRVR